MNVRRIAAALVIGTGTYGYRTYVQGTGLDGATRTKYSNEIRVAC
ncbi:hypothetical protein [Actinoplanes xinjiangensis]|uniref:Uncharacterized protein n=1 Tax=Actinoplanes xinjiangensis TaxID=512350 RepID=A0A316F6T0_9ACTN|nr:hypothetical protein [Actinoplanes xinjiangensis]PWK39775.1 hypothetical protein BC793_12142 [Actinoplanes xinjiangensis]GIF42740.1 hypothetical protein Axi01nite_70510 [Actinoplanes xinjiangensis]